MIETYCRSHVQPLLNELGMVLSFFNVTPNHITIVAFAGGILAGCIIAIGYPIVALACLLFSGLCDVLDGTVARMTQRPDRFGAYLDLISDRMVEAAFILGCMIAYPQFYLAYITFFAAVMLHFSTFVVAGSLFPNMGSKSMHYDASIVERAEAFVVFSLMLLFPQWINHLLLPFNGVVLIAGITRFFRVAEYVKTYIHPLQDVNNQTESFATVSQPVAPVAQHTE